MKIVFKIISTFLYFNFVSPVLMYYIYDDNPNMGFVALDNGIGAYVNTGISSVNSKKQFTGSYNAKHQKINNEHVVDSLFKVMKTPSRYTMADAIDTRRLRTHDIVKNNAQRIVDEDRNTEATNPWQSMTQHQQMANTPNSGNHNLPLPQIPNNAPVLDYVRKTLEASSHIQPGNIQIQPIRPKAGKADYNNQIQQRSQRNQDNVFEPKPSFVQMNGKKTQITTDLQNIVRFNNNRQLTSITNHATPEKRQSMPSSMMDKTLHKTNGLHDNMEATSMSRILDDMTQKIGDRRLKKGDYRKRDIKETLDLFEKNKRSVISDNMRKYIGKDKTVMKDHRNTMELSRIGSHEESLEVNEMPYALFYRMNPESLDQQEGFMLMRSVEDNISSDLSKEKRMPTFVKDDSDLRGGKSKKYGNALKLRKKVKKFSN